MTPRRAEMEDMSAYPASELFDAFKYAGLKSAADLDYSKVAHIIVSSRPVPSAANLHIRVRSAGHPPDSSVFIHNIVALDRRPTPTPTPISRRTCVPQKTVMLIKHHLPEFAKKGWFSCLPLLPMIQMALIIFFEIDNLNPIPYLPSPSPSANSSACLPRRAHRNGHDQ